MRYADPSDLVTLVVVVDAPVPDGAGARWCPTDTPEQEAEIRAAAVLDTLDVVDGVEGTRVLVAFAGSLAGAARRWELGAALGRLDKSLYRPGDGQTRLGAAFGDAVRRYPGDPALVIGTASPQVHPTELARAVRRLRSADAVVGPTASGGCWAVGLRDPARPPELPDGLEALSNAELTASLVASGRDVATLSESVAIGTPQDLAFVAAASPGLRVATALNTI